MDQSQEILLGHAIFASSIAHMISNKPQILAISVILHIGTGTRVKLLMPHNALLNVQRVLPC